MGRTHLKSVLKYYKNSKVSVLGAKIFIVSPFAKWGNFRPGAQPPLPFGLWGRMLGKIQIDKRGPKTVIDGGYFL